MNILAAYEPKEVLRFFEEICQIPHGSENVDRISDYLVDFANERHLRYRQDAAKNVIIWKDGSVGYENSAPVILQGHMDMVAVKVDGCEKDLETEGLDLEVLEGDLISAKGTSLGGDDGIAVAYGLALLDSNDIPHPPLELVITVNEEIGMLGAAALDVSDLKGRIFLNADSEAEGVFTVSCAGGVRTLCEIPCEREPVSGKRIDIRLFGLQGGHSGAEIDKGRLNANIAMGRLLHALADTDAGLLCVDGGEKDNAIAKMAGASLVTGEPTRVKKILSETFSYIKAEYTGVEPDMELAMDEKGEETALCMTKESAKRVVSVLMCIPNGIRRMHPDMKDMVQTSLNLGVVKTETEAVYLTSALRSSMESEKQFLLEQVRAVVTLAGGSVSTSGDYPGWAYRADSKIRDIMVEVYKEQYGKEPVVEGIHAGLECGLFSSKLEDLDCISFGPQMRDIHTTDEVLSIASTERTWKLLLETLKRLR